MLRLRLGFASDPTSSSSIASLTFLSLGLSRSPPSSQSRPSIDPLARISALPLSIILESANMSLFGSSPTSPNAAEPTTPNRSRSDGSGLFNDDDVDSGGSRRHTKKPSSNSLFADDAAGDDSPWNMPTPRKQQSRADLIRNLLPTGDVPDSYIETFDTVVRLDGSNGRVGPDGVAKVFAIARVRSEAESRIVSLVTNNGSGSDISLDRAEFNVLLALVGLAQEGETLSLDGVDERRRSKSIILRNPD